MPGPPRQPESAPEAGGAGVNEMEKAWSEGIEHSETIQVSGG